MVNDLQIWLTLNLTLNLYLSIKLGTKLNLGFVNLHLSFFPEFEIFWRQFKIWIWNSMGIWIRLRSTFEFASQSHSILSLNLCWIRQRRSWTCFVRDDQRTWICSPCASLTVVESRDQRNAIPGCEPFFTINNLTLLLWQSWNYGELLVQGYWIHSEISQALKSMGKLCCTKRRVLELADWPLFDYHDPGIPSGRTCIESRMGISSSYHIWNVDSLLPDKQHWRWRHQYFPAKLMQRIVKMYKWK